MRLGDWDSMRAHIKGQPHLSMKQKYPDSELRKRYGKGLSEVMQTDADHFGYNSDFWAQTRPRDVGRLQDQNHHDRIPAKFDKDSYNGGQFAANEDELYCAPCDVCTNTHDQMLNHKNGQNHKKRTSKVVEYRCELCLVTVPCQDMLENHKLGKDHLKRLPQLEERSKWSGDMKETGMSRGALAELELLR